MKVIDIHCHCSTNFKKMDRFIDEMDRNNVERALIHACPLHEGYADNETVAKACDRHKERLIGSMHIDLRESLENCIQELEKYSELGFRSIKMFSNIGFNPSDDVYEPFWEKVEELGLMCLPHLGVLGATIDKKAFNSTLMASPLHYEVPARRHPDINFVFAHFGGDCYYLHTITLITRFPNCYADTCGSSGPWIFENKMPGLGSVSLDKVLYGTDKPKFLPDQDVLVETYEANIKWWANLHIATGHTDKDLQNYFYNNAARVLGL